MFSTIAWVASGHKKEVYSKLKIKLYSDVV